MKIDVRLPARIFVRSLRLAPPRFIRYLDVVCSPLTLLGAIWFRTVRTCMPNMPLSKSIFMKVGVFPIVDHYYEPMFNMSHLHRPPHHERTLPGINFNIEEQLSILRRFKFSDELLEFPIEKTRKRGFYYHNGWFESADADYLYSMIRLFKPRRIVEVGGGYSTLLAVSAVSRNKQEDPNYECEHVCIEPYENPWLEELGVRLIRGRVECMDCSTFQRLEANDILSIDSSHVIRPQGDVLFECLEVLPILETGVLVHLHDVYTPRDYPAEVLFENVWLWNEQYLLESFLSLNREYRIVGAVNYLKHHYFKEISARCPMLKREPDSEPSSIWLVKN